MGANYNFTIEGDSLVMRRTPINNDTLEKAISFKSPSLVQDNNKIKLFEAGNFYISLIFVNFGLIDGIAPTNIFDAKNKLLALFGIINTDFIPLSGTTTLNQITGKLEYSSNLSATFTDRSLVDKGYVDSKNSVIFKNRNDVQHTGTTAETTLLVIPIGIVDTNTILRITDLVLSANYSGTVNTSGNTVIRLRISDTTTIDTSANNFIATLDMASNNNSFDAWGKMERTFLFNINANAGFYDIYRIPVFSLVTDTNKSFNFLVNAFGDFTTQKFIHITAELPAKANNITLRSCVVNKY
jgi:hypothetical protein